MFTSNHQFGFKSNHATNQCIFILKEICSNFNLSGSPVYVAFLDAEKAFDTVCHWILFDKLLQRGIPSVFVRILLYWYSYQEFYVKWASELSSSFRVSNGVRQGSILSPTLFNVFMNDVSVQLSQLFSGCNAMNFNHLFYADDSVLLAPSPHALQELLDICVKYAECNGIK